MRTSRRHRTGVLLVVAGTAVVQGALIASLASGTAGAAPGNNGTIKIGNVDVDSQDDADSANHPHVANPFTVSWFGFDAGTRTTSVSFSAQPPSGNDGMAILDGRAAFTFTASGAGGALDHTETYLLDTTGLEEHPVQGYHVKVTVTVDVAQGNDTKSKVFWVTPVEPTQSPTPTPSETVTPTPSATVEPSVLPTRLTRSPSISPSVKGVKIVKTLPKTGPGRTAATVALGSALVLLGVAMVATGHRRGAHQR